MLVGCSRSGESVRGIAPAASAVSMVKSVHEAIKLQPTERVTVEGEMVEKCPTAGCWFKLRDRTGIVLVDTKVAGFVVSDLPLHTHILVEGHTMVGAEATVAATGIRY